MGIYSLKQTNGIELSPVSQNNNMERIKSFSGEEKMEYIPNVVSDIVQNKSIPTIIRNISPEDANKDNDVEDISFEGVSNEPERHETGGSDIDFVTVGKDKDCTHGNDDDINDDDILGFINTAGIDSEGDGKADNNQQNDDDIIHFINTAGINTK